MLLEKQQLVHIRTTKTSDSKSKPTFKHTRNEGTTTEVNKKKRKAKTFCRIARSGEQNIQQQQQPKRITALEEADVPQQKNIKTEWGQHQQRQRSFNIIKNFQKTNPETQIRNQTITITNFAQQFLLKKFFNILLSNMLRKHREIEKNDMNELKNGKNILPTDESTKREMIQHDRKKNFINHQNVETDTPKMQKTQQMQPSKHEEQKCKKKKTIDFNHRRRRGRLRSMLIDGLIIAFANAIAIAKIFYNSIVPAICNKIRLDTFKQHTVEENVAYRIMLFLSLLLTYIIDCVNRRNLLVLLSKASLIAHIRKTNEKNLCNNVNAQKFVQSMPNRIKVENIQKKRTNEFDFEYRLKKSTTAIASNYGSAVTLHCNRHFCYAYFLCVMILLLPCSYAAKPKSATQLHKQHQQDQMQELEQPHLIKQHVAGVSFDSHGNGVLTPPSYQVVSSQISNEDAEFAFPGLLSEEQLFDDELEQLKAISAEEGMEQDRQFDNVTLFDNVTAEKTPLFPKDLFSKDQLERGAVVFHIIGVIYMFVALAIVCDEFFVPSLDVIIEKLQITDDVAGATFMAAGGSAPELFTSVIGVFVSFDDVGIGTIVGSAVFNILFVIGMCALFSKTVLSLTWWPLFRDCSFYSISLLVLIYFFRDNRIYWWEALILFSIYIMYVAFMKWNVQVERCVKKVITKNKVTRVRSTDQLMPAPGGSVTSRAASESRSGPPGSSSGAGTTGNSSGGPASSTQTGAKFRHGLLQLMIHTIDPLHDGKVDEKATQLHAIASLKVLLDATKPQRGTATTSAANHVKINLKETTLADRPNGNIDTTLDSQTNEIEEEPEPLSMAWPDTARKRLTYILVAPLLIPMWLTLPDTRTPRGKKYFPVTFIGSIVWIAAFSYLMVWWANVAGDTARIPPEVMGLTFLAAGTSIPDLITSVIVARKGFGDMAVSSSVGSNIFDVTVGLPIPWLLYGIIYSAPVEVNSVGMVCSITILFMMLLFVVMSIACFRWRMNKGLGFTMFLLYFVFVAVSLMFEYDTISCPV